MVNEKNRQKIIDKYGIDIVQDVLLANDYHVSFCFDFSKKEEAEITFISGNMADFGIMNKNILHISDIIQYLDYVNPVADIIGKDFYLEYLFAKLEIKGSIPELQIPIVVNGETLWIICAFQKLSVENSSQFFFGRINWISKEMPDAIKYYKSIYRDELTKLYTKTALFYHLSRARNTDHSYGLYFDIDNFKRINDIFGHRCGDDYLKLLGEKFNSKNEKNVRYYRLGGDEFFIYMVNCTENEAYRKAMQTIYEVERLNPEGEQVEVSASIGIIPIIGSGFKAEVLLDLADTTMYHAKGKGKGNISYARDV